MKVGLYIPCFNAAKTIQNCLDGAYRQTYPLEEILIVDDGSSDASAEIVSKYPAKLIKFNNNQGLAAARNAAISNLNTEFIASLDADCYPDPDWLEYLMKRFKAADIAGAGGRLKEFHNSNIVDFWRSVHMKQYWEDKAGAPDFLFGSNTVFKKEALANVGFYNETYRNNYEDVDICDRLRKAGYSLVYEKKAVVHHLKYDTIESLMDTYWRWNHEYNKREKYYDDQDRLIAKVKDNIGLANRYLEEDFRSKKRQLVYFDFLLAIHYSLRDFEYFLYKNVQGNTPISGYLPVSRWLALLDLTLFYHFDSNKKFIRTMLPNKAAFLQNFFALNLILHRFIREKFKSNNFQRILYKHLFVSIYKINDDPLLDKLLNLATRHQDWAGLFTKRHPNLNNGFLKTLSTLFDEWMVSLTRNFPGIIRIIERAGEKTDREYDINTNALTKLSLRGRKPEAIPISRDCFAFGSQ